MTNATLASGGLARSRGRGVKMIAEYLDHAIQFERMAAEATDPNFKESMLEQAQAYRKLAAERSARLNLAAPPPARPPSQAG